MNLIEILRQFRIGPFAVFDFSLSYIGVFLLAPLLTKLASKVRLRISRSQWLWLVLPIAIVVHILFGLSTPLTKMVFDVKNYYFLKFVIVFMLFMGLKDTRVVKTKLP